MEIVEKDLPQLIVALDSLNDDANYVHILDAKENTNYYCPCCKGIVKPRAYKKDKNYQVQAHYYHETGGCNEETFVHYICKTWLFEKGCKFIVNNVKYEVENINIEKTLYTSFGDYIPDIIVTTTVGKIFYFEIKTTNKKTELYAPKWDELGNDVVEVDTRYFINQKYKNDIPVFNLIYSDGECFIKSYSRNDYEDIIAKRKLEWKRQDKINYKIKWEQLDWFWEYLQTYYKDKCDIEVLCEQFFKLDFSDQKFICTKLNTKKHRDIKYELENYYNDKNELKNVRLNHISQMIKKLNSEFGYDSSDGLFRKNKHIIFHDDSYWYNRSHLEIKDNTTESDIYNYFHPIMDRYYKEYTLPRRERLKERQIEKDKQLQYSAINIEPVLNDIVDKINNCKNGLWKCSYKVRDYSLPIHYEMIIELCDIWYKYLDIDFQDNENIRDYITKKIYSAMVDIKKIAEIGDCNYRLMELENK